MKIKLKTEQDSKVESGRFNSFLIIVAAVFSILIARLYYLQIIYEDYYLKKAYNNSFRQTTLKPQRGKIYDVNGKLLVNNISGYRIIYKLRHRVDKKTREQLLLLIEEKNNSYDNIEDEKVRNILKDIDDIKKISKKKKREILDTMYYDRPVGNDNILVIEDDIDKKRALKDSEKIENNHIDIVEYSKRNYLEKNLASHIIGYVKRINEKEYKKLKDYGYRADDLIGKKGIESSYDKSLKGDVGFLYTEVNARGEILNILEKKNPKKGNDIYLSIDSNLQKKMTEYMKDTASNFIAIDVKTGKIITFVSSPEIDSNLLSSKINVEKWGKIVNDKKTPLLNKGIQGMYPPGSVFKLISGTSILESGISEYDTMNSTGVFEYGGVVFKDSHWNGHGITNFYKSIEESVNTYYYEYALKIGKDKLIQTSSDFGIGDKTEIDIPGELNGLLPTEEWKKRRFKRRWVAGDTINMSIGQGYLLVTPIQILMAYQALANNGIMLKPTLVSGIYDNNKNIFIENKTKIKRKLNISDKNLKVLQKAFSMPVKGKKGTARLLDVPYVDVSAKTGTAQNSKKKNHSWMAGYFPTNNPKIAFISFVEEGGYGSGAAGLQAKYFIKSYYNIPDDEDEKENLDGKEG